MVRVLSNEQKRYKTLEVLSKKKTFGGAHIGFAGWFNLDIIAQSRVSRGIFLDKLPGMNIMFEKTITLLKTTTQREKFLGEMKSLISENDLLFYAKDEEGIMEELTRKGSWLATEESFEHIKKVADQDKLVTIACNILDSDNFKQIADVLSRNHIGTETIYISNIVTYCQDEKLIKSLQHITQKDTLIIFATGKGFMPQSTCLGETVLDSKASCELFMPVL